MRTREIERLNRKLIKALLKKDKAAKAYANLDITVDEAVKKVGLGYTFQGDDGTVYQLGEATGKYVPFKAHELQHTRRTALGEKTGSLSLGDARAKGYVVA